MSYRQIENALPRTSYDVLRVGKGVRKEAVLIVPAALL